MSIALFCRSFLRSFWQPFSPPTEHSTCRTLTTLEPSRTAPTTCPPSGHLSPSTSFSSWYAPTAPSKPGLYPTIFMIQNASLRALPVVFLCGQRCSWGFWRLALAPKSTFCLALRSMQAAWWCRVACSFPSCTRCAIQAKWPLGCVFMAIPCRARPLEWQRLREEKVEVNSNVTSPKFTPW